jgi:hypothetical protein
LTQFEKQLEEMAKPQNTEPLNRTRPWRIAIPFTLIAAGFYAQGRAYYEGFLEYFGIASSQLPATTADTYWEALKGWVLLVGKGVPVVWDSYPQYLETVWQPLLILFGMIFVLWTANKLGLHERLRERIRSNKGKARNHSQRLTFAGGVMLIWMLSVPLILMAVMFMIALFLVVLILPFDNLGHFGAQEFCKTEAERVPLVRFLGDERAGTEGRGPATARILRCGTDFCALIRDGEAFVVPRQSIQRTDGMLLRVSQTSASKELQNKQISVEAQLCYRAKQIVAPAPGFRKE